MQYNFYIVCFVQLVFKGVFNFYFFIIDCSKKVVIYSQCNVIYDQNVVVIKMYIGLGINSKVVIFIYYVCNEI